MQQACNNAHNLTMLLINKNFTERTLIIPCGRFTGISKISSVKVPVSYFVKCFCAKFLEILMSGSQEIGIFPRKLFRIQLKLFVLLHMHCI